MPQSSFPASSDGDDFAWPEPGVEDELRAAVGGLQESHDVDAERLLLGGFSQGARLAVDMALRGEPFAVRGVVTVAAGVRPGTEVPAWRRDEAPPLLWFLTGERDVSREAIEELHMTLRDRGFGSRLEVVPDLGHEFPADFGDRLAEALGWVLGGPS